MKILLECTIPDEDVQTAIENGPGIDYKPLVDWIVDHLESEIWSYFTDNLGFRFAIKAVESFPQEIYAYLHLDCRSREGDNMLWKKSSRSNGTGGNNCVEVGTSRLSAEIRIRDSKQKDEGRELVFTQSEWQAFIEGVKAGEFDL
jgi:hypothetical protein